MNERTQNRDSILALVMDSVKSPGLWSFVTAAAGIIALITGAILHFLIIEIRDFSITVIVVGFILIFMALVLSPRAIAIFLVGRKGRYGSNVVIMTVAFFIAIILINFLLYRTPTRIDVTATRVFTLGEQSTQILNNLDGMVRANAFFAPTGNTGTEAAKQQAEDLLNEFQRRSSNFTYRFIDPELERSIAQQFGVTSYPAIIFENLVDQTLQETQTFTEDSFITSILIVTGTKQKVVYYLTGHGEAASTRDLMTGIVGDPTDGFDFAIQGLQRDNYQVLPLNLKQTGQVPENAATLVIAGPTDPIDLEEQQALSNYAKQGGTLVGLFDPNTHRTFAEFFAQWGILIGGNTIADVVSNVAGQELTPLLQKSNGQYFTSASQITQGIPIADQIEVSFFPDATALEPLIPVEEMPPYIQIIPLAMTTPASWLEKDPENVNFSPEEDRSGPFTIAAVVRASGTIDELERHETATFVLFGDSDFAKNKFFFSSSDNSDFFLNSVNWLAEDYELIAPRTKPFPYRELVVNKREREFIQWSSWFLPPMIMLVLGAYAWWRRR